MKRYFDKPVVATLNVVGDERTTDDLLDEVSNEVPTGRRQRRSKVELDDVKKHRTFPKKLGAKAFQDPHPGSAPLDKRTLSKYNTAVGSKFDGVKTQFFKEKFKKRKEHLAQSRRQAARAEILNTNEDRGFIEPDEGNFTYRVTQKEIVNAVDITSASKHFQLDLPKFGPYRIDYTRSGRHLALGGRMGHVAAFDNLTKTLHCETNVMETVADIQFLHSETMFAVAQRKWTYIYDNQGVELHCLKNLHDVRRLQFLPYHFLLVASTGTSFLHWLDVSVGKLIQSFPTKEGQLDVLCQNPANAIVHCGHAKGTVSLWSPNVKEPLVKMLCHRGPVRGVAVDNTGRYMVTTGMDRQLRIWDIRQYKQLQNYKLPLELGDVAISQNRVIACAVGTQVQIFKDMCTTDVASPYLMHDCRSMVTAVEFCPYEDVLGIGHQRGFVSLLVPGAGEPNIDALEANPYQSKKQRREHEVKQLLDKIQPEMISLDATEIADVDTDALQRSLLDRTKLLHVKPQRIDFQPRHRMKGKSSSHNRLLRKKGVLERDRLQKSVEHSRLRQELLDEQLNDDDTSKTAKQEIDDEQPKSALGRFRRKKQIPSNNQNS